ncbi:MAG: c-type cytochrome [Zavarzinella sp.]
MLLCYREALLLCVFLQFVVNSTFAVEPKTPAEEQKTFATLPGFQVALVASEPDIIDPVAMTFGWDGRLYVCEMIGYPNGGVGTGMESRGRIKILTDADQDGRYEKVDIFVEGLRFPTGILPWKKGFIVCNAPDLLYLEDTNGDGKADIRKVLYTGFALQNIQQLINTPRYGLDGWVYVMSGNNGGTITCPNMPKMPPFVLRGRAFRFKPDQPGVIEPTSSGGQYGLTSDEVGHWFTNTNSQHLRQIVLPDHYLKRNPMSTVTAVTTDIPVHGATAKVFRISEFEAWRVERTTRRKEGPDSKRFPKTELVPGGYTTSACSPVFYQAKQFPEQFQRNIFFCDPANNVVSFDRLEANQSIYRSHRGNESKEFIASTDNWFRPVHLTLGPDGCFYILDFYREVIETPLSLPEDMKKKLQLESRNRGRIWKVSHKDVPPDAILNFAKTTPQQVVSWFSHPNIAVRTMAQQWVDDHTDEATTKALLDSMTTASDLGQIHILHSLANRKQLSSMQLLLAMQSSNPLLRQVALRLAEPIYQGSQELVQAAKKMTNDSDGMVKLQLAFSVGEMPSVDAAEVLGDLLLQEPDQWLRAAAFSSVANCFPEITTRLLSAKQVPTAMIVDLGRMVGLSKNEKLLLSYLQQCLSNVNPAQQQLFLGAVVQGLSISNYSLQAKLSQNEPAWGNVKQLIAEVLSSSMKTALDQKLTEQQRTGAIAVLHLADDKLFLEAMPQLLLPQEAPAIQVAAIQSMARSRHSKVGQLLLAQWPLMTPQIRREAVELLFSNQAMVRELLLAMEKGAISPTHLEAARKEQLLQHGNAAIRLQAQRVFKNSVVSNREEVIKQYLPVLNQAGNMDNGRAVFRKNCATCHRLENVGYEVGADLNAALKTKQKSALLIDILDPSREIDSRFLNYLVETTDGKNLSGVLAVESATSITIRRGEKAEDTILRAHIQAMQPSKKSLMPEDFDKAIPKDQMADLLEYLTKVLK